MSERAFRKTRVGKVVSDKMDKTIVVLVEDRVTLLYIAYSKPLTTRDVRAALAKTKLDNYSSKQKEFLHFVLEQYVSEGVKELDSAKLSELIRLKYHALADGLTELGGASSAKELFSGFQQHLYTEA